jgi:hypothetical protein
MVDIPVHRGHCRVKEVGKQHRLDVIVAENNIIGPVMGHRGGVINY